MLSVNPHATHVLPTGKAPGTHVNAPVKLVLATKFIGIVGGFAPDTVIGMNV